MLDALRKLFGIIHRRETMTPIGYQRAMDKARTHIPQVAAWAPRRKAAQIMAKRFEQNGEAYYIYPKDSKKYYLGRPSDAFNIMRELGLGITTADLEEIEVKRAQ